MMAVILAGGKGTRLRPFTATIPKPLLPLGDIPILEVLIRQLVHAGVGRIVLTVGHLAPLFTAFFGDGARWGVTMDYCYEDEPLGTAGPLRLVQNLEDDFLVLNGDILTTLNYKEIFESHRARQSWGTIGLNTRDLCIDFGVIKSGPQSELLEYQEKPTISYDVSMGVNVLRRQCLEHMPSKGKVDMPDLMVSMKKAQKPVHCFRTKCYWQDMGRLDDYQQACSDFSANPSMFLPASPPAPPG